ncbi:MAG: NAD(P)-binding domain-containing protein [Phaeodactylibacter sp.]|nr:NAD(P)-binding domain-containing protein [Phaeodactylibacter sp.]
MKTRSLGFIGGGRATKILLQAFANKGAEFRSVAVHDVDPAVVHALQDAFPYMEAVKSAAEAASQDIVFVALHPPVIAEALKPLKGAFSPETIGVSLAPKITMEQLAKITGTQKWARMIPNAPAYINQGHNPFALSPSLSSREEKELTEIFSLLGNSFRAEEELLEAYAIIAAMSPTYFWYQWQHLAELGETFGLSKEACRSALNETISASANLLFGPGLSYEEVKDLIPVKPLQEMEEYVTRFMEEKLTGLHEKIKPQNLVHH